MILPENQTIDDSRIDEARRTINQWIESTGQSLNTIAKGMGAGYSRPTLSTLLNGTFEGDPVPKLREVLRWIDQRNKAGQVHKPRGVVQTRIVERMIGVIERVQVARTIGAIVGPSGYGKTAVMLAAERMYTGAVYHRINDGDDGDLPRLLYFLAQADRAPESCRGQRAKRWIIERIGGGNRLLLIDEAQYLKQRSLDFLRGLNDSGAPIILGGTEALYSKIKDTEQGAQFWRRCELVYNLTEEMVAYHRDGGKTLPPFSVEEVIEICKGQQLRFTSEAADFLFELAIAQDHGGLGAAVMLVSLVATRPDVQGGKAITLKMLYKTYAESKYDVAEVVKSRREERARKAG